jgi:hypothetical protein
LIFAKHEETSLAYYRKGLRPEILLSMIKFSLQQNKGNLRKGKVEITGVAHKLLSSLKMVAFPSSQLGFTGVGGGGGTSQKHGGLPSPNFTELLKAKNLRKHKMS